MTPEQFCYWLKGRLELSAEPLSSEETQMIREHLSTTFVKVTPSAYKWPNMTANEHNIQLLNTSTSSDSLVC